MYSKIDRMSVIAPNRLSYQFYVSSTSLTVEPFGTGKGKSVKKAKAEPSKEELHAVVSIILKKVDFNTVSLYSLLFTIEKVIVQFLFWRST